MSHFFNGFNVHNITLCYLLEIILDLVNLKTMFIKFFKVLRIDNWSKNLIIFFPYLLSGKLEVDEIMNLIYVFFSFSLIVSSTYIFNDFVDIQSDKIHPTKKHRPIASGKQTKEFWTVCAIILFIIGNLLLFQIKTQLLLYSFAYVVITITYSMYFKYTKYLDIISIAFLFLIRLFLGGFTTNTPISYLLMLFIFFICLGLISGKKLSILLNIDIKHSKIKKFLTNAYKEIELKRIIRFSFSFSVLTYLFWVIFVNVSDILSAQFLALICSVFCLMYFLTQFYSSSSTGETEDVIKNLQNKNNFFSLILFSALTLWSLH